MTEGNEPNAIETERAKVFLSYARPDQAEASWLANCLRQRELGVWFDANIGPGSEWRSDIADAIESCSLFILLYSASALASREVAKELAVAASLKRPFIALRLEDVKPKGAFLYEMASINWVNAFDDKRQSLEEFASRLAGLDLARVGEPDFAAVIHAEISRPSRFQALIRSNTMLALLWALMTAVGLFAYETQLQGLSEQIVGGTPPLLVYLRAIFVFTLGAPLLMFGAALHPLSRLPLLLVGLANTAILILILRNLARQIRLMVGRRGLRQHSAATVR